MRLFADAADKLLAAVAEKRGKILDGKIDTQTLALGDALTKKVDADGGGVAQPRQCPKTLAARQIAVDRRRRGSLARLARRCRRRSDQELSGFRRGDQARRICTMRCCSAWAARASARKCLAAVFGHKQDFPRLRILDSTVPAQIKAIEGTLDLGKTLFIVSSKSGSHHRAEYFQGLLFQARCGRGRRSESRPAIRRRHRSGLGAGAIGQGAKLSQDILRRAQHRRPLLGAVAVRSGAGGHRRHRHCGAG